jgi:hypothetical protein
MKDKRITINMEGGTATFSKKPSKKSLMLVQELINKAQGTICLCGRGVICDNKTCKR